MKTVSILDLLKSGAHFGHKTSKRYPKMDKYIFGIKGGVHVIDLEKTITALESASNFAKKISANGGKILFVGTKRQAKSIIKESAEKCNMPYIISRWLGGTFTNFENINRLPKKMKQLEEDTEAGTYSNHTKKEKLMVSREIVKLKEIAEGMRNMEKLPDAIFAIDIKDEDTAIQEAIKKGIPVIAIVDTNVNPELVDYPIPANDDSVNTIQLVTDIITEAIIEGSKSK